MTKQIKIEFRSVYGETKAYPICQDAQTFAGLAGTKTLTRNSIRGILALGYTIIELDRLGRELDRYTVVQQAGALSRLVS